MYLYFARHGESQANVLKIFANERGDYGLTDLGREQVAQLAENLAGEGINHVFASPIQRAQETAAIVCNRLGLKFETRDALREFSVGDHEGSCEPGAWEEYRAVEREWMVNGNRSARIGGGECYDDIADRFLPFVDAVKREFGKGRDRILLIGHGGTFACMLPLALSNVDMVFAQSHPFRPASFVKAELVDQDLVCRLWGDVALPA